MRVESQGEQRPAAKNWLTPPAAERPPRRIVQLDFARGLAILAVLARHIYTVPVQNPVVRGAEFAMRRTGWLGVDLFFVLSGFLVGGLLIDELLRTGGIRIRHFLARRMFKIWPAYYFYLLFQIIAHRHPLRSFLWQNLLNVQNYAGTSLSHTWSLAVEEHFYLLLPLLLLAICRKRLSPRATMLTLGAVCALVLCGRIATVLFLKDVNLQWDTHARLDSLMFGVMLGYLYHSEHMRFARLASHRIVLACVSVAGPLLVLDQGTDTHLMLTFGYTLNYLSLGALLLLLLSYRGRWVRSLVYRAVALIGVYSYGIYLWHVSVRGPVAHAAAHLPPGVRWVALWAGQYAAAILLGIAVTRLVELPMLRLRERLVPRIARPV